MPTYTARTDSKGRVVLPAATRRALGVREGDVFFIQTEGNILRLAKAENPFDALAEQAEAEYDAGRTKGLRQFARDQHIELNAR